MIIEMNAVNSRTGNGVLRRGVLALVVLLLACTLLAGAVSATEDITWTPIKSYDDLKENLSKDYEETEGTQYLQLSQGFEVTLSNKDTDRITIPDKRQVVLDLNGCEMKITSSMTDGTDEVVNYAIIKMGALDTPSDPKHTGASLTVRDSQGTNGKITLTNSDSTGSDTSSLFFVMANSTLIIESGTFSAPAFVAAGNGNIDDDNVIDYPNPKISITGGTLIADETALYSPAPGNVIEISGNSHIKGGNSAIDISTGTVTISGNAVIESTSTANTIAGGESSNGAVDEGSAIVLESTASYEGQIVLTIKDNVEIKGSKGAAIRNYVRATDYKSGAPFSHSSASVDVTISDTVTLSGEAGKIVNQKYSNEDDSGPARIGNFTNETGAYLLYPGLNNDYTISGDTVSNGVTWTGDATDGYTLAISGTGTYKLMSDVTLKSMKITSAATIDGNDHTLTLLGTKGQQGVITSTGGATLQNLTIKAAAGAEFGTAITMTGGQLLTSNINLENLNSKNSNDAKRQSSIAVYMSGASGTISGNTIQAGNSADSSSQCIVVGGTDITVSDNELTTGSSATYKDGNAGALTSGSVGIRLVGEANNVKITGNTITSKQTETSMNNGIALDGVSAASTVTASGNTFVLSSGDGESTVPGNAFYLNPKPAATSVTLNADENIVTSATNFIAADNAESGVTGYTIGGTIKNNNFAAITGDGLASVSTKTGEAALTLKIGTLTQSGNSGVLTNPSETATVDTTAQKITLPPEVTASQNGENVSIAFTGYEVLITNATVSGSEVTYGQDNTKPSTAIVTHDPVAYTPEGESAPSSTIHVEMQIPQDQMDTIDDLEPPKAAITAEEKNALTAAGIRLLSVVDIPVVGTQVTLKIEGLTATGDLVGFHIDGSSVDKASVTSNGAGSYTIVFTGLTSASPFGIGSPIPPSPGSDPQPSQPGSYSSGDGNMNNAYRVLFETNGGSFIRPATDLSAGDKITAPANPVKDGYTFAGWYKDAACTQGWSFSDAIDGDMTLYAKWTGGSTAQQTTTETAAPTAQPTTKQTTAPVQTQSQSGASATTAAPAATTAAGVSPTLTQAPAPVLGALLGLLAAGVLIRRRE